jgi:quercetin dioxygenase-like cupin family protein
MRFHFSGRLLLLLLFAVALAAPLAAQSADQMSYAAMSASKFGSLPVLPACMTFAVDRGDPTKGAAVLLIKMSSGCVVPWHWHTANETLMMVSGHGKAEMKAGGSHPMTPGDYIFLPAKQAHQFTCVSSCRFFLDTDAAFDIHYVDAGGKEIPPDQALKPMAKPAAAKKP